jgi:glutamine synthetase
VHQKMLSDVLDIFTVDELKSRYHVLTERYTKDLLIEANTLRSMLFTSVLPAAYETRKSLADTVVALKGACVNADPETAALKQMGDLISTLQQHGNGLIKAIEEVAAAHDNSDALAASALLPVMQRIRETTDQLEMIVPDKAWPFPKYTELLFSI